MSASTTAKELGPERMDPGSMVMGGNKGRAEVGRSTTRPRRRGKSWNSSPGEGGGKSASLRAPREKVQYRQAAARKGEKDSLLVLGMVSTLERTVAVSRADGTVAVYQIQAIHTTANVVILCRPPPASLDSSAIVAIARDWGYSGDPVLASFADVDSFAHRLRLQANSGV